MKPCEVCGSRHNGTLATKLMKGPRGYRRYQACPKCRQTVSQKSPAQPKAVKAEEA